MCLQIGKGGATEQSSSQHNSSNINMTAMGNYWQCSHWNSMWLIYVKEWLFYSIRKVGMSDSKERNQLGGFCVILHGHGKKLENR